MASPFFIAVALLLTSGCKPYFFDYSSRAFDLAKKSGFSSQTIKTDKFLLQTFHRASPKHNNILTVYIEGDGHAWANRSTPSLDPTPIRPIGLQLAVKDDSNAVLYIGRPCQYIGQDDRRCSVHYWTSHRFAEEVISSTNQAITYYSRLNSFDKIRLVGFSGGGTVAALVAARRSDVERLVTVAGILDHKRWTKHHSVSPLAGSLNPIDYINTLSLLPQHHLIGEKDKIVPRTIFDAYLSKLGANVEHQVTVIDDYDHDCCWADSWDKLLPLLIQ
ncbi:MAG: alpha/beta hydrolase [Rhodospirillales bacterium]|nr:alpha/beta hydrolase [Rhodospirillales bacterium]